MNLKRLIGSAAVTGAIGASTLGIGAGIANANPTQSDSGPAVVQQADWRGGGHGGYGGGHGFGRGYGDGHGFRGGWPGYRWWHPWGGPWRW
jgi:hypothetical protein